MSKNKSKENKRCDAAPKDDAHLKKLQELEAVLEQLKALCLIKHDVPGDGNCMFHALALVLVP